MSSVVTVTFEHLRDFIARGLEKAGIPAEDAQTVAGLMAKADMQGSDGHGVIRLPQYFKRIKLGGINTKPQMRIIEERAGTAVLHGDNGMGHLVVSKAVEIAMEKAKQTGVAWVGTRYSNHAGPASLYASMPIEHDMLSLYFAVGNANHMPPWGGMDMLLSTNPIAAGIPSGSEVPIVLDMATTVVAYGKVKAKAKRGEQMPEGWMIDREGKPLLDPNRAAEGFLLPIGGHKGYGLALLVGMLAGTLGGAAMGKQVVDFNVDHQTVTNTGQAIMVLDLKAFGDPAEFKRAADTLIGDLRTSERLPGVDRIWLPGEQSHLKRQRFAKEGIPIAAGLAQELAKLAQDWGIAPLASSAIGAST
jgi:L-2-hydroxycarboxylate dehydrogenase (NAD+)